MMNLTELVGIVANSRARTAHVFPLPDVPGCVDYAITESGEFLKQVYVDLAIVHATHHLDAKTRARRIGDKRNNAKSIDARKEWGQCGYMIASGLMQTEYDLHTYAHEQYTLYQVLFFLALEAVEMDGSLVDAMAAWVVHSQWCEWNPAELLRDTCADFERKHLREAVAA